MDENAVVSAVCAHLESQGFRIAERRGTSERGIDVVAQHVQRQERVLVEAKGATSSQSSSARFGKPYLPAQIFDRVAKGVFTCLQLRAQNPDREATRVLLALPEGRLFRRYAKPITELLASTGVEVWFATTPAARKGGETEG
ncbi:MAG: hypothetical protein DDT34_02086 [Firmicutes bacterium]|nr:hypothetical protein [Bacillota bacterium]